MRQQEQETSTHIPPQGVGFVFGDYSDPVLIKDEQDYLKTEHEAAPDVGATIEVAALAGSLIAERLISQQTSKSIASAKEYSEATQSTLEKYPETAHDTFEFEPGIAVHISDKEYNPKGRATQQLFGKGIFQSRKMTAVRDGNKAIVSYARRRGSSEVVLEGFYISPSLRGEGKGVELINKFMDRMRVEKRRLTRTETIRKPGISLTLEKAGFTLDPADKSQGIHVVVLPKTPQEIATEKSTDIEIPPLVFVSGERKPDMSQEQVLKQIRKELNLANGSSMRMNRSGKEFYRIANDSDNPTKVNAGFNSNLKIYLDKIANASSQEQARSIRKSASTILGKRWVPPKRKNKPTHK